MPLQYVPNTAIIYNVPVPTKQLENKIHPRTLKEFARTGSNPVQCADSNQRDPIQVPVSEKCINNLQTRNPSLQ